jgi:polar amino acid transport system substrate-binding protein
MHRLLLILIALTLMAERVTAEQEGLDAIRQQGYVRICADPANPPFSSADATTPGFEVELARLVARELGVEARLQWYPTFVRALAPLRDGLCDLFMGLPQDERFAEGNPWLSVSRPYYVMRHALVAKADAGIAALSDLSGKRVAVDAASVADFYVFYAGLERGLYKGQEEAFRAVVAGEAHAALLWLPVASWLAQAHPELRVVPVSEPRLEFPIGAGVRRRMQGLAPAVDAAIERLQDSGEVQKVLARHGAIATPPNPPAAEPITVVRTQETAVAGRSLFSTACSRCHGAEGVGGGTGGNVPSIRNYADGQEKFLRIVLQGKKGTPMAPFKGILTEEEILSIYHYLTSLPR